MDTSTGAAAVTPRESRDREHLLALKVMRLTRPSLVSSCPILGENRDIFGATLSDLASQDLASVSRLPQFGLSQLVCLPQNFGNIFLGETFTSYISVHNDSGQTCKSVTMKADLQTSTQRLSLNTRSAGEAVPELVSGSSIDDIIHHEVKELGTHILVCAVTYTTEAQEPLYFRKFFKFQVLKPLDIKTKFSSASEDYSAGDGSVFLEASIQNITPSPIFMERVSFEPTRSYKVNDLNHVAISNDEDGTSEGIFGRLEFMKPLEVRQYLYHIFPIQETPLQQAPAVEAYKQPASASKGLMVLGKLDIAWRSAMGERGRLQTSGLQRLSQGSGDLKVKVLSLPDCVEPEKPFSLQLAVINCCDRSMSLVLSLAHSTTAGLFWAGKGNRSLGSLPAQETQILTLELLATKPGLWTISGLVLTDTLLKRPYEYDELAQIYVEPGCEP